MPLQPQSQGVGNRVDTGTVEGQDAENDEEHAEIAEEGAHPGPAGTGRLAGAAARESDEDDAEDDSSSVIVTGLR